MTKRASSTLRRLAIRASTFAFIGVALAAIVPLVAWAVTAEAQQVRQGQRIYRIGVFSPASPLPGTTDSFRKALADLGYVDGKNIVFEVRYGLGKPERLPELVTELINLKVDVLVCGSTAGVLAARRATTTIPIVFASVFDPVGSGIVPSLARPGGNVTGSAIGVSGEGFGGKWVQLLKESVPNLTHVAVLWNATNPSSTTYVREAQAAARILNIKVDVIDVANAGDLDRALSTIGTSRASGMIVTPDPLFHANRTRLTQFAANKRVPAIYFSKQFVDAGGFMAYGASFEGSWRRAAVYVDKILKGAKPADLPIEQPTTFELVVNSKAASKLGLTVPQSVLQQADHIVE